MPFTQQWLIENRVKLIHFHGDVSLDDITKISAEHDKWLASTDIEGSQTIYYIIEARNVMSYPRDIRRIRKYFTTRLVGAVWMLFVTDDFFITHLGKIFGKLLGLKIEQFHTVVEAYRFLQEMEEIPIPEDWSDSLDETMPQR